MYLHMHRKDYTTLYIPTILCYININLKVVLNILEFHI